MHETPANVPQGRGDQAALATKESEDSFALRRDPPPEGFFLVAREQTDARNVHGEGGDQIVPDRRSAAFRVLRLALDERVQFALRRHPREGGVAWGEGHERGIVAGRPHGRAFRRALESDIHAVTLGRTARGVTDHARANIGHPCTVPERRRAATLTRSCGHLS